MSFLFRFLAKFVATQALEVEVKKLWTRHRERILGLWDRSKILTVVIGGLTLGFLALVLGAPFAENTAGGFALFEFGDTTRWVFFILTALLVIDWGWMPWFRLRDVVFAQGRWTSVDTSTRNACIVVWGLINAFLILALALLSV